MVYLSLILHQQRPGTWSRAVVAGVEVHRRGNMPPCIFRFRWPCFLTVSWLFGKRGNALVVSYICLAHVAVAFPEGCMLNRQEGRETVSSAKSTETSARSGWPEANVCFRLPTSPLGWRGKLHGRRTAAARRVLLRCWFCVGGLARKTQLCADPHSHMHVHLGRSTSRSGVWVPPMERSKAASSVLAGAVTGHAKGASVCPTRKSCEV